LKASAIKYRRGKTTQSPYKKYEKNKKAYQYPVWVTRRELPPIEIAADLVANILRIFPKLSQIPPEKRVPRWLWVPRAQQPA